MKTTLTIMLMLMFAVGLAAITELVDFNDTANLTSLSNHKDVSQITAIRSDGFVNSGSRLGKTDIADIKSSQPVSRNPFSGAGEGTPASPYVITTPAQLDEVRNFLSSNFVLANDIDLD